MEKKYYKLDVSNLFNLGYYSLKKNQDSAANIHNVYSLNYYYVDRYPSLMKHVNSLAYDNYWYRENNTVSSKERAFYNIPDYLLVEASKIGYFEYFEVLTGISFIIPSEALYCPGEEKMIAGEEITKEQLLELFNDDYVGKICSLFDIRDKEQKENFKQDAVKKLTLTKNNK